MNTPDIEHILRKAPRPKPPGDLKGRLRAQVAPGADKTVSEQPLTARGPGAWLSRWWPALAPAAVSLACAAVFTVQQIEIRDLKQAVQALPTDSHTVEPAPASTSIDSSGSIDPAVVEQAEIDRLKQKFAQLSAEISRLEQMQGENQRLRAQLSAGSSAVFSPEETKALEEMRDREFAIHCVNNMKQLGLAARIWAQDNGDKSPPNILEMTNEMSTPKILFCPADTGRRAAESWAGFSPANCSYEYLAPSAPDGIEPNRVLFRCPIHGNIGLVDGSVQMRIAKSHPEWLVQREGKLYLEHATIMPEPLSQ